MPAPARLLVTTKCHQPLHCYAPTGLRLWGSAGQVRGTLESRQPNVYHFVTDESATIRPRRCVAWPSSWIRRTISCDLGKRNDEANRANKTCFHMASGSEQSMRSGASTIQRGFAYSSYRFCCLRPARRTQEGRGRAGECRMQRPLHLSGSPNYRRRLHRRKGDRHTGRSLCAAV